MAQLSQMNAMMNTMQAQLNNFSATSKIQQYQRGNITVLNAGEF